MKHLNLILLIFILSACEKETIETCTDGVKNQDEIKVDCGGTCSACDIEYPETGSYGENILFGSDTLVLTEQDASMKAIVPQGSSLKIELTLMDGEVWFYTNEHNWSASTLSDGKQTFMNIDDGVAELLFHNGDTSNTDTIMVKYFENGNDETKRKILIRE